MLNEAGFWRRLDNGERSISVGLGDYAMASHPLDSNLKYSKTAIERNVKIDKLSKA
jgi:hypothetical protein